MSKQVAHLHNDVQQDVRSFWRSPDTFEMLRHDVRLLLAYRSDICRFYSWCS
jgi:hypothetical protein